MIGVGGKATKGGYLYFQGHGRYDELMAATSVTTRLAEQESSEEDIGTQPEHREVPGSVYCHNDR